MVDQINSILYGAINLLLYKVLCEATCGYPLYGINASASGLSSILSCWSPVRMWTRATFVSLAIGLGNIQPSEVETFKIYFIFHLTQ